MRQLWSERYLWVHLGGLAALPIVLILCVLALAIGDPLLPVWLEWLFVAGLGIAPVVWMQWQRPFYIFSLLAVALVPEQLTPDQQRILRQFKLPSARLTVGLAAVIAAVILWPLYQIAPIATGVLPLPQWRLLGLVIATFAFLIANVFLQVPVSVLRILCLSDSQLAATEPYPIERIRRDFSIFGLQVNQILPPLTSDTDKVSPATSAHSNTTP